MLLSAFLFGCRKSPKENSQSIKVEPEKLVPGPIVHEELTEIQKSRITAVQKAFSEVDPTPLGKWMEDFQRDRDPDREIEIWEAMAEPFTAFTSQSGITLDMKKEAFSLLLSRSGSPSTETLKSFDLTALSPQQAQDLLDGFMLDPKPITVTPKGPN